MTVWVLMINHRHGHNTYVCQTEDRAWLELIQYVDENWGVFGMILHTLRVEIAEARKDVTLNERGQEELADKVADAVDGDLGADILEALKLPQEIKDLVVVRVEWV